MMMMIQEVDDEKFKKLMWQTYNFKNYESIEGLCSTLGVVRYGMLHVGHDTTDVGDDVTHVCARPVPRVTDSQKVVHKPSPRSKQEQAYQLITLCSYSCLLCLLFLTNY